MKALFRAITAASLRLWYVTLALAIVISVLGIVAVTQLRQELIPPVAFPQTIILAQASGMTSEQVRTILTERMEAALDEIPQIVNLESTTTGAFGTVITARNNFGDNQERLRGEIRTALDSVWVPGRRIAPPADEAGPDFARRLLADLPADVLIYLASRDANFLFQLTPEIWEALSDDAVRTTLAYIAAQTQESSGAGGALRQLIDQEIAPALVNLDVVASVSVSGGQALPDEGGAQPTPPPTGSAISLLLQLSPEVWSVAAPRAGLPTTLGPEAVAALADVEFTPPVRSNPPALPDSWQSNHFSDASDLVEMRSLTRSLGSIFESFLETGAIVGPLGQTDDLTPDDITNMLAIDPGMVEYFEAEHLVAMTDEVFAALPEEFIAGLDGFTRDELAAKALAQAISGEDANPAPVDLPTAWRISPPQLITFSFDDLPLATFTVSGTGVSVPDAAAPDTAAPADAQPDDAAAGTAETELVALSDALPEGPAIPQILGLFGTFLGVELNTADDLIDLQLPENLATQFGGDSLSAAQFLNFLVLLGDPDGLPAGAPALPFPVDSNGIIGSFTPEAVSYLAENDPGFASELQTGVFEAFSDAVLALPNVTPPLDSVWNALANQPQFGDRPLRNASDLLAIGDGRASSVLNTIEEAIPAQFAGYETRLFNSLSPALIRSLHLQEPGFFTALNPVVLTKLSPEALATLPAEVTDALPEDVAAQVRAIAAGEQPSAFDQLAALYATDVPPADPEAPVLAADWQFIGDFIGVELDSADDFFRFFPNPTNFLNSFFDSAQGINFAPNLFGSWTPDVVAYMLGRDGAIFNELRIEALQLMTEDAIGALPAPIQERLASGAEPFVPTDAVTRTNGSASLFITVFKSRDANTVEAFHQAEEVMRRIDEANDDIVIGVSFEQASFIEESISGVAREGGLGAVFAVIVILIFLSSGIWARRPRFITAIALIVVFGAALALLVAANAGAVGGDFQAGWDATDVVVRVLLIAGIIIGVLMAIWPGKLPRPAWRSTIVTGVSIPLSVLMALALMRWVPPSVNELLAPAAEGSSLLTFLLRLFPPALTINIMTLSGLTVAIGRVVDDSIVVLENIFRHVQEGEDKRKAIIEGTRDVSVAIFAATVITVVVFLPLGLTGGIIGEFFLPFGLAVTYSLLASFIVAITVVPVMAWLMLDRSEIANEDEGFLEKLYVPALRWALSSPLSRTIVLLAAFGSLVIGGALFAGRPQAFLPSFGEPQIGISVNLPSGTPILETNRLAEELEAFIAAELPAEEIGAVQVIIGSSGFNFQNLLLGNSSVSENVANITIAVEDPGQLDALTAEVRAEAETIFGRENVTVSAASLSEQGFGGFALVLSGPQADLEAINTRVIETLNTVPGLTNVSSNIGGLTGGNGGDAPVTYIRIDRESAVRYTGELETENTLGVTAAAKAAVSAMSDLPATITVSEGFESRLQTEGFANLFVAMGIAIAIVVVILMITFGSVVHWLDIILSIVVAPVGAAVALALTDRVLGISAMIGLLMLIGIVVTNAVVLIDRVQTNRRERGMNVHDALLEAGQRRLRPILMTALATIGALFPLAVGLSKGAIIASELGTVVIGGLFSSTLLTLIVVPVAYSLLSPVHKAVMRAVGLGRTKAAAAGD